MALGVFHFGPVPKRGTPPAMIAVGFIAIKDKPAPFHFSITEALASLATHFIGARRKIHMLSDITMDIVDVKLAAAFRKSPHRISIRPALTPRSALAGL